MAHGVPPQPSGGDRPKRRQVLEQRTDVADELDLVASLGLTVQQWEALPEPEQDWWRARRAHKQAEHTCGHPREVCADPARTWYPQMAPCHVEMETEAASAKFARLHAKRPWHDGTFTDWAEEASDDHPYHYTHGLRIWVTEADLELGGDFTARENPYEDDEEDARGNSS